MDPAMLGILHRAVASRAERRSGLPNRRRETENCDDPREGQWSQRPSDQDIAKSAKQTRTYANTISKAEVASTIGAWNATEKIREFRRPNGVGIFDTARNVIGSVEW